MTTETRPDSTVADLFASGRLAVEQKYRADLGDGRELSLTVVRLAAGVTEPAHTHPGFEVMYGLSGHGSVRLNGKAVPLPPGETVHVAEGAVKAIANGTDTPLVVLAVLVLDSSQLAFVPVCQRGRPRFTVDR